MKITDLLSENCIKVPLQAADKRSAIEQLVDLLKEQGKIDDRDLVLRSALERERIRSTGMERGLAVPHCRCSGSRQSAIAVGIADPPIDFGSLDGQPVSIIVFLTGPPEETGPHIQALARVSRLMLVDTFRSAITRAKTPGEAYAIFVEHEHS